MLFWIYQLAKIWSWSQKQFQMLLVLVSSFWQSQLVQDLFEISNKVYLNGEEYSHEFIIQKLDISGFLKKNIWKILLESSTEKDLRLLREKLNEII